MNRSRITAADGRGVGKRAGPVNFNGKTGGQDRGQGIHSSILVDPPADLVEKADVEAAKNPSLPSRERVSATQAVFKPENVWKIFNESPNIDSKELARYKLRGLGYDV